MGGLLPRSRKDVIDIVTNRGLIRAPSADMRNWVCISRYSLCTHCNIWTDMSPSRLHDDSSECSEEDRCHVESKGAGVENVAALWWLFLARSNAIVNPRLLQGLRIGRRFFSPPNSIWGSARWSTTLSIWPCSVHHPCHHCSLSGLKMTSSPPHILLTLLLSVPLPRTHFWETSLEGHRIYGVLVCNVMFRAFSFKQRFLGSSSRVKRGWIITLSSSEANRDSLKCLTCSPGLSMSNSCTKEAKNVVA